MRRTNLVARRNPKSRVLSTEDVAEKRQIFQRTGHATVGRLEVKRRVDLSSGEPVFFYTSHRLEERACLSKEESVNDVRDVSIKLAMSRFGE